MWYFGTVGGEGGDEFVLCRLAPLGAYVRPRSRYHYTRHTWHHTDHHAGLRWTSSRQRKEQFWDRWC